MEVHKNSQNVFPDQNIKPSLEMLKCWNVERDMCKCFIRGLKPEIRQRIASNLSVQETVADANRKRT